MANKGNGYPPYNNCTLRSLRGSRLPIEERNLTYVSGTSARRRILYKISHNRRPFISFMYLLPQMHHYPIVIQAADLISPPPLPLRTFFLENPHKPQIPSMRMQQFAAVLWWFRGLLKDEDYDLIVSQYFDKEDPKYTTSVTNLRVLLEKQMYSSFTFLIQGCYEVTQRYGGYGKFMAKSAEDRHAIFECLFLMGPTIISGMLWGVNGTNMGVAWPAFITDKNPGELAPWKDFAVGCFVGACILVLSDYGSLIKRWGVGAGEGRNTVIDQLEGEMSVRFFSKLSRHMAKLAQVMGRKMEDIPVRFKLDEDAEVATGGKSERVDEGL